MDFGYLFNILLHILCSLVNIAFFLLLFGKIDNLQIILSWNPWSFGEQISIFWKEEDMEVGGTISMCFTHLWSAILNIFCIWSCPAKQYFLHNLCWPSWWFLQARPYCEEPGANVPLSFREQWVSSNKNMQDRADHALKNDILENSLAQLWRMCWKTDSINYGNIVCANKTYQCMC